MMICIGPGLMPLLFAQQAAAEKRPLSAEVLWELKRIGGPVISPDGKWIVAPITHYTVKDDKSHTDLWLFSSDGKVQRPLTQSGFADGQAVFSPDGQHLAFVSKRDGDDTPQIYLLPMKEPGEARRLSEVPTGTSAPKWAGDYIYFITRIWPDKDWNEMAEQIKKDKESKMSGRTWNALPYSHFDHFLDEKREAHIYRIPTSGGTPEAITYGTGYQLPRSTQSAGSYDVAPDNRWVAFQSNTAENEVKPKIDILLIEPGKKEVRNISPQQSVNDAGPSFSPDGKQLAIFRQNIRGFYAENQKLFLHDLSSHTQKQVAARWDRSLGGLKWSHDSKTMMGSVDDAGTQRIYQVELSNGRYKALTKETDFTGISIAQNGSVVVHNQSFVYPPRLYMLDVKSEKLNRIENINDDVLANVEMGKYESVTYKGANGKDIQMWVHYPPGFDPSKKYPLFLLIHGGPHNAITDGFHFRWNAQTFASWGYVTAWHNFHGSSGFGEKFTDAINPDWITRPYEDTRKAAEWFASKSWVDKERMVAGGGSYGGYLSSILLGKEHPFKALVIHAAVYNLYSQMSSDFAVHSQRFGDYWDDPSIYKTISPHYFAGNFNTPSLIIHGQLDYRVPVGQGFELFRTLQHRGIDSRLIYYPDENHWILKPNNSLYWYAQVREWIEKYAKPRPAE